MSLLEDVFLQDEANEAEELERVIEGDEFEERRRSDSDDNSEKEGEAEEDKRRVDPTKAKTTRVIKNPRFLLNPARLTGPRGIQVIPDHFKDFKFKGKGHEKEDLDLVLKRLEHWAYRLYPKFQFEDCLKKIEMLGKKRPVAVHLHKIRSDQFLSEDTVVQKDSSDEDTPMPVQEEDEFDKLLQQQIDLARSTPAPNSAKKPAYGSISPKDKRTTSLMIPKATSSPSISDEQRERMLRSRKLAEERRLARLKNAPIPNNIPDSSSQTVNNEICEQSSNINLKSNGINGDADEIEVVRKQNRSNVIESSDEEIVGETHVSIVVDVHNINSKNMEDNKGEQYEKISEGLNQHHNSEIGVNIATTEQETEENVTDIHLENSYGTRTANSNVRDENYLEHEFENKEKEVNVLAGNSVNDNFKDTENSAENEELRYDDSDVNNDTNEHNISDKAAESNKTDDTIEIKDYGEVNRTEDPIEENKIVVEIKVTKNNTLCESVHDKTSNSEHVSQEIIDVMDVDFSDDF